MNGKTQTAATVETATLRKVALATIIGTATEWYDYFLYGTASALVFGKLFFTSLSQTAATLATFAVFSVTFIIRPIGAALFGHYGDRLGRKSTLVVSILLMGIGTFCVGLLPTYNSIGVWAPVLLILLRMLQGFAVGGEYGGATVMALEYAPPRKRGLYAALPQIGNPLGLLFGTLTLYVFTTLPEAQFLRWGWRVPFLLSAVLVAIGLHIRLNIAETPAFRRAQAFATRLPKSTPLVELLKSHRRALLLTMFASAVLNMGFYVFSTWSISYLTHNLKLPIKLVLFAIVIASALDVFAQPLFGALSDRVGRRPVFIFGSLWFGLVAFPFFWLVNTGSPALIILAMILTITIGHGATYSVQASFVSELFGTGVRYSGLSICYHVSTSLFSGPAPFVAAALLAWTGGTTAVSVVIVVVALVSAAAIALLAETKEADIDAIVPASAQDGAKLDRARASFQRSDGSGISR